MEEPEHCDYVEAGDADQKVLGRYDYIGVDSWARKLVSKHFYGGQPVGEKEIQAAFDRFGRWRALAYWSYRWDEM